LLIGRYVMATAEHREPCDSRGSCTVLGAPGGEIPPGDSTPAAAVPPLPRVSYPHAEQTPDPGFRTYFVRDGDRVASPPTKVPRFRYQYRTEARCPCRSTEWRRMGSRRVRTGNGRPRPCPGSRAADPPHKRQTFALRATPSAGLYVYRISRGGEMCLFLIFFWCSRVLGDVQARRFFAINSRFGEFNSRLGRREFPVRSATGIGSQAIDLLCRFFGQAALMWGKSKKFPVRREKPGTLLPLKGRNWCSLPKTAPTSVARSRSSRLLANRAVQPSELIAPKVPSRRDR
jgi:hypothetical protein